jgi:rRNA maturation endonuclease Nob1
METQQLLPITCWSCDTIYDYSKHEFCPICDAHWLDGNVEQQSRVSVRIEYDNERFVLCKNNP